MYVYIYIYIHIYIVCRPSLGAVFNLLAIDASSSGGHQGRMTLMGFCAVTGAVAMFLIGDRVWLVASAFFGAWFATRSFVEIYLVPRDAGYMDFLRCEGTLHVEYAKRDQEYDLLVIVSLFCEYIHLEYIRIHGI